MGRRTLVELLHVAAGIAVALWLTTNFARSYPLGREVIWWCGTAAMLATLAMAVRPVRRAMEQDRMAR